MSCASRSDVSGARHYSQLVCWQLADSLRQRVLTVTPRMAHDFKRRAQMEDASDSICRNIAEGFGCLSHAEFARYLEIARRSLNELVDSLRSARLKGYMSINEFNTFSNTINRLYPAINKLIAYLRKPDDRLSGED